jgi:exopolyphosphatase/guanosine-5'-triphosphate,3'-diphosphate pyrophosphatase
MVVRVLEDVEAGALIIGALKSNAYASDNKKTLLVYGGTGTVDFELLNNNQTLLTHSIKTGLLKITEMLKEAAEFSRHTEMTAQEYLDAFLARKNRLQDLLCADELVFGTENLQALSKLFKQKSDGTLKFSAKKLFELYHEYHLYSITQICRKHSLKTAQGENLYALLTLLAALLRYTGAKEVVCVQITHGTAMLDSVLRAEARKNHNERLYSGALSSAFDLAARYNCDMNHCDWVSGMALAIFKSLKKICNFNKKQSLLLHVACILHESGHYTNSKNSKKSAFHLLRNAHIYGLCSHETLLTANIISPRNLPGILLEDTPLEKTARTGNSTLIGDDALFVAKMHAISRIADALDYSHKQKAEITDITLDSDDLVIKVQLREDFTLERWMFNQRMTLFRNIFGITPKLIIDNVYD